MRVPAPGTVPIRSPAADYSEAPVSNLLHDQLPQPGDGLLVGRLGVIPKLTQLIPPLGVGDVLVVSPEAIEPAIELGDEVVVVVGTAGRFAEVGVFVLGGEGHGGVSGTGKSNRSVLESHVSPACDSRQP